LLHFSQVLPNRYEFQLTFQHPQPPPLLLPPPQLPLLPPLLLMLPLLLLLLQPPLPPLLLLLPLPQLLQYFQPNQYFLQSVHRQLIDLKPQIKQPLSRLK
jgi:hypothetical protein